MAITFESLAPFYDVGIKEYSLKSKIVHRETNTTLYVNKDKDDIIESGWALFNITKESYPLRIQFVRMVSAADMDNKVVNIEKQLTKLTALVKKLLQA